MSISTEIEGKRFREEIDRLGGTTALARAMGMKPSSLYTYIRGETLIGVAMALKLSNAGVDMDYVRNGVHKNPPVGNNESRIVPPSNVGRIYFDAPTDVDVLQPVLRQRVHAGDMMPVVEQTAEFLNVTRHYKGTLTVEVEGDSMIDAGINDGDRVVIKRGMQPRNGDVVFASLNDKFLLKGYELNGDGHVILWPANPKYDPIPVNVGDEFVIDGTMIELIRKSDRSWLAESKKKHKRKG